MNLRRRPLLAILAVLGVNIVSTAIACGLASHLVWNHTASLPLGLYWVTHDPSCGPGDLVLFPVPASVRELVRERRYLPAGDQLLKPVVAVAGDRVCIRDGVAFVNDAPIGAVLQADFAGRPLPVDTLCGPVPPGHIYVASHHPRSFDSRAFGLVDADAVRGKAVPVWTF
jgi:conjugative transfer signal peptidase TraF